MPTDTFFNLPEDKRIRIIDAAIDEFAIHSYHKSSINRIVQKAEIAKGSFYQYFDNKKDLFKYIINLLMKREFDYSDKVINSTDNLNFFETLRNIFIKLIEFYKEHPRFLIVGINFMKMDNEKFKEEMLEDITLKSNQFFKSMLVKGVESGELDLKINVDLTAVILTDLIISLIDYSVDTFKSEENMEVICSSFDKVLNLLENGIKSVDSQ